MSLDPQVLLDPRVLLETQLRARTKSLFSAMRKMLRLGDMRGGGRSRGQLQDLLGLRVVVHPRTDLPDQEAELAARQVSPSPPSPPPSSPAPRRAPTASPASVRDALESFCGL